MPANRKPAERRQRRNRTDVGLVVVKDSTPAPAPQRQWYAATKTSWSTFWGSQLAGLVQRDTDLPALERLWSLYDERERAYRSAQKGRLVEGSQGQPVINPLVTYMTTLDKEIRALEDRFGLTPMARLKLGVKFGEAARSLADLNEDLERDDDEDPRLSAVDVEAG